MKYPKRFSRAQRKKLRSQIAFQWSGFYSNLTEQITMQPGKLDLKKMQSLWNSVTLAGNLVPTKLT